MRRRATVLLFLILFTLPLFSAPKVALVLSGGGARGFAHIPVIEAVEAAGIPIDLVLGTSMGSLVGGLYAAGYTPLEIRSLIDQYNMVELFASTPLPPIPKASLLNDQRRYNLFQIGLGPSGVGTSGGMLGDQKILQMLNSSLCRVATIDNFDELEIPFRAVGANLVNGERIVFSKGSIVTAIRSSISIPGVFAPYPVNGKLVVDGGVVDNLPIDLAKEMGADIIIAVDVNGEDYKTSTEELDSVTAVLEQTVVIFMKNTYINQLENADILIVPPLGDYSILDFLSVKEILKIGEEAAAQHQGELAQLATQIGEERELRFLDKGRGGSYFKIQEPFIAKIVHRPMEGQEGEVNLKSFSQFVGLAMGEEQKWAIQHELDNLRKIGQFSTVTCELVDVVYNSQGEAWGLLEVQTRQLTPKRSTISLGAYGTNTLTFNPTRFEVSPNFALKYNRENLFEAPFTLSLTLTLTDTLQVGGELTYNFSPNWSAGLDLNYTGGGILPQHLRYGKVGLEFRDHKGEGSLLVRYRRQEKLLIQLTNSYPYYWFGTTVKGETFSPSLRLDAYYSSLNSSVVPFEGLRVDLSVGGEVWGYSALVRYQQIVRLARRHYLYFDLRGESSRPVAPQATSFITLGGSEGVPSHLATTLTDDLVIGRVKYLFVMGERPFPLVLHAMATLQSYGQLVKEEVLSPSLTPFSSLDGIESSFSLAVGFPIGSLEFLFGVALDTTLRTTIFLEVL